MGVISSESIDQLIEEKEAIIKELQGHVKLLRELRARAQDSNAQTAFAFNGAHTESTNSKQTEHVDEPLLEGRRVGSTGQIYGPRKGGLPLKARAVIRKAGQPLYIDDIIAAIVPGKPPSKSTKRNLARALKAYADEGRIFTYRTPATFGLLELGHVGESNDD